MILFKTAAELKGWLEQERMAGRSIGFVPTMGALHTGHISLIDISKKTTNITVCSIFVNPTQFNDPKDFIKYPITIEKDILLLEKAGTNVLFLPEAGELYPDGTTGLEHYDLGRLETLLEGKYRPGHFQGVCQVMRRLLDIVEPADLFMGQKDYQQCMVLRRLIEIRGYSTRLHTCPIIRETDGLAMSSRNMRLGQDERKIAPVISQTLNYLKEGWNNLRSSEDAGETGRASLLAHARSLLEQKGLRVDYVEIADACTLEPLSGSISSSQAAVALIAAFLGEVRLIDNMLM
jgi:pantoate--beta-alanine ligase